MADLGNLWFSLRIKDGTEKEVDALIKKIEKKAVKLNIDFDKNKIAKTVNDALKGQTFKANVDVVVKTASVQQAIQQAFAKAGINQKVNYSASDLRLQRALEVQARMQQQAAMNAARLNTQLEKQRLAQIRVAKATGDTTNTMRSQNSTATALGNTLAQVYSVYALQNFARQLIQIGGQFETQHIALKSMLGDATKANVIFSQIKGLAVESPFTFMNLVSYTKQLEAFSIPYNELYDTTKRLADISAGLGVPMERLILAFGQVRAASYLRGQEVRQFTEAGIPLLEKLAENMSLVEGKAISTGEVFNRISRRQVSFDMVKDVLWQMTDEGGQFYNMQAELVESLSGKMEKFRDSFEIMMGDIAEAMRPALGGALDTMTEFTKQWETLAIVIAPVVSGFVTYKTCMLAANLATKASNALSLIRTRYLTAEQNAILASRGVQIANTTATTANTVAKEANNAASVKGSASTTANTTATAANTVSKEANATATNIATAATSRLELASIRLGAAFKSLGTSWWGALLTALVTIGTLIYSAWSKATKLRRELDGAIADTYKEFRNGGDNFKVLVDQLGKTTKGSQEYEEVLNRIQNQYGQYLGNVHAEADAYGYLKGKIEDVTTALRQKYMEDTRQQLIQTVSSSYQSKESDTYNKMAKDLQNELKITESSANYILSRLMNLEKPLKDYNQYVELIKQTSKDIGFDLPTGFENVRYSRMGARTSNGVTESFGQYKKYTDLQVEKTNELNRATEKALAQFGLLEGYGVKVDEINKRYNERLSTEVLTEEERLNLLVQQHKELKQIYHDAGQSKLEQNEETEIDKLLHPEKYNTNTAKPVVEDPYTDVWKERINMMKEAQKEYEKYVALEGKQNATERMQAMYPTLEGLDFSDMKNEIRKYYDEIQKQATTDKQKKVVLDLRKVVIGFDYDDDKKALDEALEKIKKEVQETVKSWDLYKKIFDATGNKNLAAQIAFGGNMQSASLLEDLQKQIENRLAGNFTLADVLGMSSDELDANKLQDVKELIKQYKDEQNKIEAAQVETLLSMLKNYKDYAAKVKDIETKLAEDIAAIEAKRGDLEAGGVDVDAMIAERNRKAQEDKAKLQFEQFRNSADYTRIFDDLDNVSTKSIRSLINQMQGLKESAGQNLPINDFKQLITQLNKLEDELISRNPFKEMKSSLKDYISSFSEIKDAEKTLAAVQTYYKMNGLTEADNIKVDVEVNGERKILTLAEALKKLADAENKQKESSSKLEKAIDKIITVCDSAEKVVDSLSDTFDALGNSSCYALDYLSLVLNTFEGMASGVKGLMSGNFTEMVQGATSTVTSIIGLIGGIAELHDKKLDAAIEKSKARLDEFKNAYDALEDAADRALGLASEQIALQNYALLERQVTSLGSSLSASYQAAFSSLTSGNVLDTVASKMSSKLSKGVRESITTELSESLDAVGYNSNGSNSVYMAEYADLLAQRAEIEEELAAEEAKKKTDKDAIADYTEQLEEVNQEIAYFTQDLVKDLYDIDFDDWASQLSDSLMDAFRNGEDAAKAFQETANDILADVAENVLKLGILEPMMESLQTDLFGTMDENGNMVGGIIDTNDLDGTMKQGMEHIADWFNNEGKEAVEAMQEGFNYLDEITGGALTASSESSGLSNSISGITETTADLLASYLNAIRADVSVIRALEESFFSEDYQSMNVIAQSQLTQLRAIAENTALNAQYAEEINTLLKDVANGTKKLSIR